MASIPADPFADDPFMSGPACHDHPLGCRNPIYVATVRPAPAPPLVQRAGPTRAVRELEPTKIERIREDVKARRRRVT